MRRPKCAPNDFTEADLPGTRRQVFFDCYKEHFSVILRAGLLCFLFLFPVLATEFLRDVYIVGAVASLPESTDAAIAAVYHTADVIFGLAGIVAFSLFAAFLSGVVRILRQTIWGEPLFFWDDFRIGFKSDALRFASVALLLAIQNYLVNLLERTFYAYVLYGAFAVIVLPIGAWMILQTVCYRLKWFASAKNAVIYYVRTLPATILLIGGTVLPFFLVRRISSMSVKYAVLAFLSVFGVVPLVMVWMLYAFHTFDRYLNREHYPQIYRKGMRPEGEQPPQ